jgi:cysteinyl-tRNA synthetase
VNIQAEKMSKSLGNVLTVRDLLSHVAPDALKLFLLGTHYRAPLDFSEEAMIGAGSAEDRLRIALDELQRIRETQTPDGDSTRGGTPALLHQIGEAERGFTEAMDDDFNTPRALAAMFGLTREVNVALREAERALDKRLFDALCDAEGALRKLGSVLGGLFEGSKQRVSCDIDMSVRIIKKIEESDFLAAQELVRKTIECGQSLPKDAVDLIVKYRDQRRDQKDWVAADAIRAWLAELGVIVDDTSRGARWRVKTVTM